MIFTGSRIEQLLRIANPIQYLRTRWNVEHLRQVHRIGVDNPVPSRRWVLSREELPFHSLPAGSVASTGIHRVMNRAQAQEGMRVIAQTDGFAILHVVQKIARRNGRHPRSAIRLPITAVINVNPHLSWRKKLIHGLLG